MSCVCAESVIQSCYVQQWEYFAHCVSVIQSFHLQLCEGWEEVIKASKAVCKWELCKIILAKKRERPGKIYRRVNKAPWTCIPWAIDLTGSQMSVISKLTAGCSHDGGEKKSKPASDWTLPRGKGREGTSSWSPGKVAGQWWKPKAEAVS